ncbi:MAG: hypothetical protein QM497_04810 [Sulfurimonas sp.]
MDNPLKNLNLKWWHTVLLTTSFFIFVLSLTVDMKISDNETISFLSSSVFFMALGSFANRDGYTLQRNQSKITPAGTIFYIVGSYLLYRGMF